MTVSSITGLKTLCASEWVAESANTSPLEKVRGHRLADLAVSIAYGFADYRRISHMLARGIGLARSECGHECKSLAMSADLGHYRITFHPLHFLRSVCPNNLIHLPSSALSSVLLLQNSSPLFVFAFFPLLAQAMVRDVDIGGGRNAALDYRPRVTQTPFAYRSNSITLQGHPQRLCYPLPTPAWRDQHRVVSPSGSESRRSLVLTSSAFSNFLPVSPPQKQLSAPFSVIVVDVRRLTYLHQSSVAHRFRFQEEPSLLSRSLQHVPCCYCRLLASSRSNEGLGRCL